MKRITNLGGNLVEPKIETSSTRLDSKSYFNTKFFDFQRIHAYPETKEQKTWELWRNTLRSCLNEIFCLDKFGEVPTPDLIVQKSESYEGYRCDKIAYQTLSNNWVSAYLLVPQGPTPPTSSDMSPRTWNE